MPIIQRFLDWVLSNMPVIENTFKVVFGVISDVVKFLYDFFEENMLPIFQFFYDWVMDNMPVIQATATMVFDKIIEVATTLWDFYKKNLLPIFGAFLEFIKNNMPLIQELVTTAFNLIWTAVELVWDIFSNVLLPILQALWDFISPTFPLIEKTVTSALEGVLGIVKTVSSGFETLIGWVKGAIDWLNKFNSTEVKEKTTGSSGSMGGISSGLQQFTGGKRALGGSVNAGQTYMVGERGPELVTFGRSGMVTPNHELGGQGINITINNPVMTDKRMVDEIGKQLVSTLRAKGLVTT
jgi:phage-related protein